MRLIHSTLAATGIALGGLALAGYAIAENAGNTVIGAEPVHFEPEAAPVGGEAVFGDDVALQPQARKCVDAEAVIGTLASDMKQYGGETVALVDGMQQEFADLWRSRIGAAPVPVSLVLAHIVPGADGAAVVDVVEIGSDGCALSRTLLAGDDWQELLESARGIEV